MPDPRVQVDSVPSGQKFRFIAHGSTLTFGELFERLASDVPFTDRYTALLRGAEFEAFYWEHPPLTADRLGDDAEFVLLDAPELAQTAADPAPFAGQFARAADEQIAVFENLGGDALLIAPCPLGEPNAYPHLAAFVRHAPPQQLRSLWRVTAETVMGRLGGDPRWLSTAGLGVAWLHLRLDSRPKYYSYRPYAEAF